MRADRLLSILLLLQTSRRLTARELAKRLEVSERTTHRDMEALGAAGVLVLAERGTGGGWSLLEGCHACATFQGRCRLTPRASVSIVSIVTSVPPPGPGD